MQGLLYDVGSTQLVFSVESGGSADDLADILCDGIARAVVKNLGAGGIRESSLSLDPDPEYNHLMITGMGHYYNGNLAAAFPVFMKILRDRPQDEPAQFWLARSFYQAEMKEFAAVELQKYLDRHPQGNRRTEVEALLQKAERSGND